LLEQKAPKIQDFIKMLAFLSRRYLSRQARHDAFVDRPAFVVAGVWLRTWPSHAYLLQETQAHFYKVGPFEHDFVKRELIKNTEHRIKK